jgi:hypothetical protein
VWQRGCSAAPEEIYVHRVKKRRTFLMMPRVQAKDSMVTNEASPSVVLKAEKSLRTGEEDAGVRLEDGEATG